MSLLKITKKTDIFQRHIYKEAVDMADSQYLFSHSLISSSGLPDGFTIRPLARDDYRKGFYECLGVLTWVAEPTEAEFLERFDEMIAARDTYFFAVVEFRGLIVGTGCLVAEKKLYGPRLSSFSLPECVLLCVWGPSTYVELHTAYITMARSDTLKRLRVSHSYIHVFASEIKALDLFLHASTLEPALTTGIIADF